MLSACSVSPLHSNVSSHIKHNISTERGKRCRDSSERESSPKSHTKEQKETDLKRKIFTRSSRILLAFFSFSKSPINICCSYCSKRGQQAFGGGHEGVDAIYKMQSGLNPPPLLTCHPPSPALTERVQRAEGMSG